jgi:hypothetical protein
MSAEFHFCGPAARQPDAPWGWAPAAAGCACKFWCPKNIISSDYVPACRIRMGVFIFIITTVLFMNKSLSSECSHLLSKNLKNEIHLIILGARARVCVCVCNLFLCPKGTTLCSVPRKRSSNGWWGK